MERFLVRLGKGSVQKIQEKREREADDERDEEDGNRDPIDGNRNRLLNSRNKPLNVQKNCPPKVLISNFCTYSLLPLAQIVNN